MGFPRTGQNEKLPDNLSAWVFDELSAAPFIVLKLRKSVRETSSVEGGWLFRKDYKK
ncbi:hypothetical protein [Faecalicatena contorta]|uniref:hypothetical protein n=1 Tax=Faecalicatena contorta TaxID=39482 RepID=UPI001A9A6D0A|nr:hypothetical protein [Faecalicatena contorta]